MTKNTMRVVQESIAEMVAQKIRDDIMNRTLKSGDKIREVELSKQLNVSRTPVREAFRILQSEGLVVHNPRVGVVVTSIGINDVVQLYEVRGVLEQLSAYSAASHITEEQLVELKEINNKMRACAQENPEDADKYDIEFHIYIAKLSHNPILEEQLAILHRKTRMVLNFVPFQKGRIPYSCKEHDDIINALEQHEPEIVKKYMDIHFQKSTKSLRDKIIAYNSQIK